MPNETISPQKNPDIAEQLYLEVGERFTMDQLETRTGVSRTTLYRSVGSKTTILQMLADQCGEAYMKASLKSHILLAARAVVAGGYGIPAVVGVLEATSKLQSDQYVRVNGDAGYVEILHSAGRDLEMANSSKLLRSHFLSP